MPIKTGLIGFGLGGRIFHAPFIDVTPGLELTAVVQRGPWKQPYKSPQQAYPSVRLHESAEAMIADPDLQLIVISTPHDTHYDLAKSALLAGKHIVIDKPLTATSEEARELILLARSKNLVLAPYQNRRFDADFLTVQKVLASGELGRLVTFESHFDRYRPVQRPNTWKESAGHANGLLYDLAPHLFDQPFALFGKPDYITANIRQDRDRTDIEDAYDITFHYARLTVHLRSTMIAADPAPRFLLHGTHGSFRKHGVDRQEPKMLEGAHPPYPGEADQNWLPEPESLWGTLTVAPDPAEPATLIERKAPSVPGDYRLYYANVRDAINGDAPLIIPAEQGYRIMRALEIARQSSAEKRSLAVTDADWNF